MSQNRPAWKAFRAAVACPQAAQETILKNFIHSNAATHFGRQHGFDKIHSVADFQWRVPKASYEDLSPWIERAMLGEANVLTAESIKIFERTSGSTSINKLIPYNRTFLKQLNSSINAWLYNLYSNCPQLIGTRSYWSISPVARERERTQGGIPIGMEDDLEYFGPIARWAMRRLMAVPNEVAKLRKHGEWKQATCQYLLAAHDLGLISIWSPTFITLLMEEIAQNLEFYLKSLPPKRAYEIRENIQVQGGITGSALWPKLQLISCWTDASAAQFLPEIQKWFPRQIVQGKGLLATEGIVSFPLWGQRGGIAAITSHFLEFIDLNSEQSRPRMAHELKVGGCYSPLLTTGSGLFRYHLRDMVECIGFLEKTPLLRFMGRIDSTTDLCGEKINILQIQEAFDTARNLAQIKSEFFMMIPIPSKTPYYCGLLEGELTTEKMQIFESEVERILQKNAHYAYCRKLGQLAPAKIIHVSKARTRYSQALMSQGMKLGDIKPVLLDKRELWLNVFAPEITLSQNVPRTEVYAN